MISIDGFLGKSLAFSSKTLSPTLPLKVSQVDNESERDTEPPSNCGLWIRSEITWSISRTSGSTSLPMQTDGHRIQLLTFKPRELQAVRYRRLNEYRLPPRLTSTVGRVDYYLQEIRNVITTKEDAARLWPGVQPKKIKTLTLDGGQACVIGAFADIPEDLQANRKGKEVAWTHSIMEGTTPITVEPIAASTTSAPSPTPTSFPTPAQQPAMPPLVSSRTVCLSQSGGQAKGSLPTNIPVPSVARD